LLPFSLPALFPPDLFLMKITFAGVFSIDSEAFKNYNSLQKIAQNISRSPGTGQCCQHHIRKLEDSVAGWPIQMANA